MTTSTHSPSSASSVAKDRTTIVAKTAEPARLDLNRRFTSRLTRTVGTAMLPALFFAMDAGAQVTDEVMDEVVSTGRYLSIDKLNAVKTPTAVIDIPQSLSIIGEARIEAQGFTDLGDVARYTPGVTISQGEGHRDAVIIRGQQTTADFFQDGIRDDVQYFRPLYNLEQVEVLRGANALLFGRGGTGGIVNRVTKLPELSGRFTGVRASVDTFGAHLVEGDVNAPIADNAGVRLNAFYEGLDNHRDFYDGTRFGINPTALVELSPTTSLDLSYEYLDDDRTVDRGVPSQNLEGDAGQLLPDVPLKGFRDTFFGSPDANLTTLQAHIARAHVEHVFNDTFRANVTAQYADYDKLYQNLYASEEVQVLGDGTFDAVELDGYRDATDRQNLFLQANLVGEFDTGRFGHTLLIGAEYGNQQTENSRFDNVFDANGDDQLVVDFIDPLDIPAFAFSDLARDRASDVDVFSLYAQDQIDITENFKLLVGGRFDSFDIDVDDLVADAQFSRTDEEFSPRLGAIYKPAENLSIYASYSESFLPRSGDQFLTLDLTNSQTAPQGFENREVGFKWNIRPGVSFAASAFEIERDNFLTQSAADQEVQVNVEGSRTRGVELEFDGRVSDRFNINANYTYLDGEVRFDGADIDGNATRQTPDHSFAVWANYELSDRLGLGVGATAQDSFFVREDNSVEVPGYTRLDASVRYDVSEDLRVQLNIENLLDVDYFPDAHSNDNISTGAPLNGRLTVSSRF